MRNCWTSSAWSLWKSCYTANTGSIRSVSEQGGIDMRNRLISWTSTLAVGLALFAFTALPVAAQSTKTAAKAAVPRMPDGHPDLQGTYDLATITPLERLPGDSPSLTK